MIQKTGKPRVLFFGTGSQNGGGSGIREMLRNVKAGVLNVEVVGIVTNFVDGGVDIIAKEYGIRTFISDDSFDIRNPNDPGTISFYQEVIDETNPDFAMLSGWVYKVPAQFCGPWMLNIHPGLAAEGIDKGKCGKAVHLSIINSPMKFTAVTIHQVNANYDDGNIVFRYYHPIEETDTDATIAARTNKTEHCWQSYVLSEYIKSQSFKLILGTPA